MIDPQEKFECATAPRRDSKHWKQGMVTWGDLVSWLDEPGTVKEAGNYVLGEIRPTRACQDCADAGRTTCRTRTAASVVSRSAITLDVDTPPDGFVETVQDVWDGAMLIHTTYSSSPDQRKYRLIVPTDRRMSPDEYVIAARALMQKLGGDGFDPSTDQPWRYMFRPAAQRSEWYESWVLDGDAADVDGLLGDFDPDLSTLPLPKPSRSKRDPFEIEGIIGSFNRAYRDWDELIESYDLPYERISDERWALQGAHGAAGMGIVTDGLVYSHHVSDPAYGEVCSAFDLVRLHMFHELDDGIKPKTPVNKRPSHRAMLEHAAKDPRVIADMVGLDFDEEMDTDHSWKMDLRMTPKGRLLDVVANWELLRDHDPVLTSLRYNEITLATEATADLPWRPLSNGGPSFTKVDVTEFCFYVEREYKLRPSTALADAIITGAARARWHNPITEYLSSLQWDGQPRVEASLPGVTPTKYTRMVARKALVAAVARAYEPGIKWDHTLVLYGPEGIGKTFWVERMARGWYAQLGGINDKDTLLTMQRSWIITSDEAHTLRKADANQQKEFLTRTVDVFRMPYDREAQAHPRRCVIWGTTNDEVFLRIQEGNRRFLIVKCDGMLDFSQMTPDYVDQVWAEAVHLYREGERLFLTDEEIGLAKDARDDFTEEDALAGVIQAYLERPVPDDYETMTADQRRWWADHPDTDESATHTIDVVCTVQIWYEAIGSKNPPRRTDLLEIGEALRRIPGWVRSNKRRIPPYGPQQAFVRTDSTADDYRDLI